MNTKPATVAVAAAFCLFSYFSDTNILHAQVQEATELLEVVSPPLDDLVQRSTISEKKPVPYPTVREADLLWEKRVWSIIDTREKRNLTFRYPEAPFFSILTNAILNGRLQAYSTVDDKFTTPLSSSEVRDMIVERDTVETIDVETGLSIYQAVENELNWETVFRFRIKEIWWMDAKTGQLQRRILGIAPLVEVASCCGPSLERPLFWVYYPHARSVLAQHQALATDNTAARTTWEDLFEMRFFAAAVYRESNIHGRRIQDYLSGSDALQEGQQVMNSLRNKEEDNWGR
jgi:gliding motility associated protien GldN